MKLVFAALAALIMSCGGANAVVQKIETSGAFEEDYFLPTAHDLELELLFDDAATFDVNDIAPMISISFEFVESATGNVVHSQAPLSAEIRRFFHSGNNVWVYGLYSTGNPYVSLSFNSATMLAVDEVADHINANAPADIKMQSEISDAFIYYSGGALVSEATAEPVNAQVPVPASLPLLIGGIVGLFGMRRRRAI